ncbi:hypothetical protein Tco_0560888 [Tanacetum coccineum]
MSASYLLDEYGEENGCDEYGKKTTPYINRAVVAEKPKGNHFLADCVREGSDSGGWGGGRGADGFNLERKRLSRNCKAKNSSYGNRANNVDIWWARNKYPGVIVNESFIFVTHSLFLVRISKGMERRLGDRGGGGCYEVGGGSSGGVVGGFGVVCGDVIDRGVGGVDCGVVCGFVCGVVCEVKAPIFVMIVRVLKKYRWCGTKGKDVIVDRGGGEDIKFIFISVTYAEEVLKRAHMKNYNPRQTPVDTYSKLGPDGEMFRI